jgi:hypothetical protein
MEGASSAMNANAMVPLQLIRSHQRSRPLLAKLLVPAEEQAAIIPSARTNNDKSSLTPSSRQPESEAQTERELVAIDEDVIPTELEVVADVDSRYAGGPIPGRPRAGTHTSIAYHRSGTETAAGTATGSATGSGSGQEKGPGTGPRLSSTRTVSRPALPQLIPRRMSLAPARPVYRKVELPKVRETMHELMKFTVEDAGTHFGFRGCRTLVPASQSPSPEHVSAASSCGRGVTKGSVSQQAVGFPCESNDQRNNRPAKNTLSERQIVCSRPDNA